MNDPQTTPANDCLQGFIFEDLDIRGQVLRLGDSYRALLDNHDYPQLLQSLLGEFAATATLLSSHIKFDGVLTLQGQGDGAINAIMAECRHQPGTTHRDIRAIVRHQGSLPESGDLPDLLGQAQLAITVTPDQGTRYQSLVPLTEPTLADCVIHYFDQSEQLPTRIWLHAAPGQQVCGLLLQALPKSQSESSATAETDMAEHWQRLTLLADTLGGEEFMATDTATLLHRLFHEETIRLFDPEPVHFNCNCSRERTLSALASLGQEEIGSLFATEPEIATHCEFCNTEYRFGEAELKQFIAAAQGGDKGSPTVH